MMKAILIINIFIFQVISSVNDFSVIIIWSRGDFHKPTVEEIGPTLKYGVLTAPRTKDLDFWQPKWGHG